MWAFQNLSAMRTVYKIDKALSEAEALAKIQEIINTEPEVDTTPTAEERIASALEFQNVLAMDDASTTTTEGA